MLHSSTVYYAASFAIFHLPGKTNTALTMADEQLKKAEFYYFLRQTSFALGNAANELKRAKFSQ